MSLHFFFTPNLRDMLQTHDKKQRVTWVNKHPHGSLLPALAWSQLTVHGEQTYGGHLGRPSAVRTLWQADIIHLNPFTCETRARGQTGHCYSKITWAAIWKSRRLAALCQTSSNYMNPLNRLFNFTPCRFCEICQQINTISLSCKCLFIRAAHCTNTNTNTCKSAVVAQTAG